MIVRYARRASYSINKCHGDAFAPATESALSPSPPGRPAGPGPHTGTESARRRAGHANR